jgi:hypothetical protein
LAHFEHEDTLKMCCLSMLDEKILKDYSLEVLRVLWKFTGFVKSSLEVHWIEGNVDRDTTKDDEIFGSIETQTV